MSLWQSLQHTVHPALLSLKRFLLRPKRSFHFDSDLIQVLQELADVEQRPVKEVATELIANGLAYHRLAEENLQYWQLLSLREQQVVALVCLNYSNLQIAGRLGITGETVRTHIRNVLSKFNGIDRIELRKRFLPGSYWDFEAWESAGLDSNAVHLLFTKLKSDAGSKEGNIFTSW